MSQENQLQLGDKLAEFDGKQLTLQDACQGGLTIQLDRDEVLELFDFISRFTHAELNRRASFRVPVVSPELLEVRLAVNMKLVDAHPVDMSLSGILLKLDEAVEAPAADESIVIQLGMGFKQLKLEATPRRHAGKELSLQFSDSVYDENGEPPELLVDMFMELQRDWLTSRFRHRPL